MFTSRGTTLYERPRRPRLGDYQEYPRTISGFESCKDDVEDDAIARAGLRG